MGDVLPCSPSEATAAVQRIVELKNFWLTTGSDPKFIPAIKALTENFTLQMDATLPDFCAVRDLGLQAKELTAQIATAAGVTPPPAGGASQLETAMKFLGGALTVWGVIKLITSFSGRDR